MSASSAIGNVRYLVPPDRLSALIEVDSARAAWAIGRQWLVIIGATGFALSLSTWWAYAVASTVVATRQHGLLVLMHDGAHGLLARRRLVNDMVSDVFLAFPLFVSTALYRRHHFAHHRYLNSENDPDLDLASEDRSRHEWMRIFLLDVLGVHFLKQLNSASQFSMFAVCRDAELRRSVPRWQLRLFVVQLVLLTLALLLTGTWVPYLLLWLLPSVTVLTFILRVRAVAEHVGCGVSGSIGASRTVLAGTLERAFFAPCNINLHLAHHLFPAVPCHRLPELQRLLSSNPALAREARFSNSYLFGSHSVLAEIATPSGS